MLFDDIYKNKRVFMTGLTGFKGTWFALWLQRLGATVLGYSNSIPGRLSDPKHLALLDMSEIDIRGDVRDDRRLKGVMRDFDPEIVFHLAAQPLVLTSYDEPLETFSTNMMGTANLLQACRESKSVKAVLVVTTDKVYENKEAAQGFVETDRLGGYDPYSASKACAELLSECFRRSFFQREGILLATARAGNVIGGGDWSRDRLIPDLMRNAAEGHATSIRMPGAVRPWQHVLEPLRGYLMLVKRLLEGDAKYAGPWNFGPNEEGHISVAKMIELANREWNQVHTENMPDDRPPETVRLTLNCGKARDRLGWEPVWNVETAVAQTVEWYREFYRSGKVSTSDHLERYIEACDSDR